MPGARLLAHHLDRARALQARALAGASAVPMGSVTSESIAQPGIQLRPALDAGEVPTSVATGDFNGDGRQDFVVANGYSSNLWFYAGNGDGTFQLPRVIPLSKGLSPVAVAAADLRKSGKLDLIVAEIDSATIGVLLGNGDGTFGYETEYAVPEPPGAIVVDDFNHDGKLDVAAVLVTNIEPGTNHVPYIAMLAGDGSGQFASPVITPNWGFYCTAWNIASGDVNGDGLPDLLITGPEIDNSAVYFNNGDGTFAAGPTVLGNNVFDALLDGRLADVTGDGCLDAVIADAFSNVWIVPGDCSGKFGNPRWMLTGDSNAAIRVADVNGDGIPDIVTSSMPALYGYYGSTAGNTLTVILGKGEGQFGVARNYVGESQAYSIGIADFNGDGKLDFVTANNDSDTVTVYQNDGTGGFGFPQGVYAGIPGQGTINAPFSALSFADVNKDGKADAFFLDEGYSGELFAATFLNDGTGRFRDPMTTDLGIKVSDRWPGDSRLGNFRDAQHLDLASVSIDINSQGFILFAPGNSDGSFGKPTVVAANGASGIITTGDFNHDGKLDLVAINGTNTHTLTSFLGNGDGTFHALSPISFSDSVGNNVGGAVSLRAYTGDFNRDGKLDVLVFTSGNGYWTTASSVWELDGNGDGTFQTGRQLFTGFQPITLADLNGDGNLDIARYDFMWPDGTSQTIGPAKFTNYLDQPDGTFAKSSSYSPYAGIPLSVAPFQQSGDPLSSSLVADLNGDGKPDEIAFQATVRGAAPLYAQALAGNGDGTLTPTYDIFPFYLGNYPLYAHDLDGSGSTDLVNLIVGTSSLQVLKGGRAPSLQIALRDEVVQGNSSCGWVFPNLASDAARSVNLFSSVSGVQLPSSVTIPAGAVSAQFCYTLASTFDWRQVFDVNAQLDGDTATAHAASAYTLGFSVGLSNVSPALLYSGQSTNPITVTVTASPGYTSTAKLYCEGLSYGDSCQFASGTIGISPAAAETTTVTFILGPNATNYGNGHSFTVVVDDGNIIQRQATKITASPLFMYQLIDPVMIGAPGSYSEYINLLGIPPFYFSCSGLPAGATCSFTGAPASFPSSGSETMVVATTAATPPGSYPVTVAVSSGGLSASQKFSLQVLSLSMTGPEASKNWVPAGGQQVATITATASLTTSTYINLTCSLDVSGATCNSIGVAMSQTPQTASLTISVPPGAPVGQHILTVTATTPNYSQTFTFPFYVEDYSGSLSTSSLTMPAGGSGNVTATLSATSRYSKTVSLACSGTSSVYCLISPASVQLVGGTPQAVTVTLSAPLSASGKLPPHFFAHEPLLALTALAPFGLAIGFWRRVRKSWLTLICITVLMLMPISCSSGGGGSSGGGSGGGSQTNTYTVTITAYVGSPSTMAKTLGVVNVTVTH